MNHTSPTSPTTGLISHRGIVVAPAGPGAVTVRIEAEASGCSGCGMRAVCRTGSDMTLRASLPPDMPVPPPGARVRVTASTRRRTGATALMLGVPVALLIAVVAVTMTVLRLGETAACLSAIGAVGVWYGVLALTDRSAGRRQPVWSVDRIMETNPEMKRR